MMNDEKMTAVRNLLAVPTPTPEWAFKEYERIRPWLPDLTSVTASQPHAVRSLESLVELFDAFIFDAFGVLNIGQVPIAGAVTRFRTLQASGKRCLILSNAATATPEALLEKYRRLGYALTPENLICSRELLHRAVAEYPGDLTWGIVAPPEALPEQLPVKSVLLHGEADSRLRAKLEQVDSLILLSSHGWTAAHQRLLEQSLAARPRPVLVANPDLVAPREAGLSLEPGYYAHRLADQTGIAPVLFGKPYRVAFETALARLGDIPRERILMVGDTLHTDILGGRCVGVKTLLVTAHGALQGMDVTACMAESGIYPDFVAAEI